FPEHADLIDLAFREADSFAERRSKQAESSGQSVDTGPEPPRPADADLPLRLGRYRVLARLGAGGFGVVYKGDDEEMRPEVAIKVPPPDWVATPESAGAYLAEARVLASLDHPAIVPIYDFGQTPDGLCYLVSKFISGSDLKTRLTQGRPTHRESAEFVVRVA